MTSLLATEKQIGRIARAHAIGVLIRLVDDEDAKLIVRGEGMLRRMELAGWIKPKERGVRSTVWSVRDLDAAVDRYEQNPDLLPKLKELRAPKEEPC